MSMTECGLWDSVYGRIEEQKGCEYRMIYPMIDVKETGKRLKGECERRNISARQLQDFLGLAALQSVYGWFQGRSLPSLDNFYALSCYLGVRMEDLVVPENGAVEVPSREANHALERRMMAYFGYCLQAKGEAA